MPRTRHKKYPGSIYTRTSGNRRLIIEYRGEKIYTRLPDTKDNRKVAEQMLWVLWRRDHGLEPAEARTAIDARRTPDDAWSEYEEFMRVSDKSRNTIRAYRDAYHKMRPRALQSHEVEEAVQAFIKAWQGAPGSINIHLRNYETFLQWAHRRKYLDAVPELKAYRRRGTHKPVQILTYEEVAAVVRDLQDHGQGDLSQLVVFLYETGLRITEALSLTKESRVVVNRTPVLQLSNKTSHRQEHMPLTPKADAILSAAITNAKPGGTVWPWQPSSSSRLTSRFNAALQRVGVTDATGFHLLRKSFRHRLQISGVPMDVARRLMRHSNIRVTDEHYTLYEVADLSRALVAITEAQEADGAPAG